MKNCEYIYESTLCFDCQNATKPEKCPWVNDFTPVDGWDAEETICEPRSAYAYTSYLVKSCPLFVPDRGYKCASLPGLDGVDMEVIKAFAASGMRTSVAASIAHYDRRTVSTRLTQIRLKTGIDPREFDGLSRLIDMTRERR